MSFERPAALVLILVPIVALAYHALSARARARRWALPLEPWGGGRALSMPSVWNLASALSMALFAGAWALLCLAAAEPSGFKDGSGQSRSDLDIVFVLDVSPSMAAMDIEPNRLKAAQAFVGSYLAQRAAGASVGLVAFGQNAALVCPVTPDLASAEERLSALAPGMLGDGTAIGQGLALAARHLSLSGGRRKAAVLITDGEDNVGMVDPREAAANLGRMGALLAVIGMGVSGDVPFRYEDPATGELLSGTYRSGYDERQLEALAESGWGSFVATRDVQALARALEGFDRSVALSADPRQSRQPLGPGLILASLVLAALAWSIRRVALGGLA